MPSCDQCLAQFISTCIMYIVIHLSDDIQRFLKFHTLYGDSSKIIDSEIVVCSFSSSVADMSLCAVNKTGGILVSSSKIFCSDMQTKKQKAQMLSFGQRATLVSIMSLPHFSSDIYCTVNLMLIWKHEDINEYLSQFCGVVSLHMEDLINSARRKCQYLALYPLKTQVLYTLLLHFLFSEEQLLALHVYFPGVLYLRLFNTFTTLAYWMWYQN